MIPSFREQLGRLLNTHSKEAVSNTPDFILAEYLTECLVAFDRATIKREKWYGVELTPGEVRFGVK
jgi:hypothetical protein